MSDFVRAAWPVVAALVAGLVLWMIGRFLFRRGCWRCNTPLELYRRKHPLHKAAIVTRCERCGAWRGCLVR